MAHYKLPRSQVVPIKDNRIPKHGLSVDFAVGTFEGQQYCVSRTNCLWPLIGASIDLEPTVLCTVKREDLELDLLVYGDGNGFIVFMNPGDQSLKIFGGTDLNMASVDCTGVFEPRWNMAYFLPKTAYVSFERAIALTTSILQTGDLPIFQIYQQSGPTVMKVYHEMEQSGVFG